MITNPTLADLTKKRTLPLLTRLEEGCRRLSPSERLAFGSLALLLTIGALGMLVRINREFLVSVPREGGTLTEGIVGSPRFINPLLALSDADRDLTALIYAGLLRPAPDGELMPDLAEELTVSDDGLLYTATLRADAAFHDGAPLTADDVLFTVERAKDPAIKSPKRVLFEGVGVRKLDDRTVEFSLRQPYAPFLENLTIGILPRHVWKDADAELFQFSQWNIEPVGAGPYRISKIKRNSSGVPTSYELLPFSGGRGDGPYLAGLTLRFYGSEEKLIEAYRKGEIESMAGISPKNAEAFEREGVRIELAPLPRVFGVFFNQNRAPVFANREVRRALELALDKEAIVADVLGGYGEPLSRAIPPSLVPVPRGESGTDTATSSEARMAAARSVLIDAGWRWNEETARFEKRGMRETTPLAFSLSTGSAPELRSTAEHIKSMWTALGAAVELSIFEPGDLNQSVIRPRQYDALFFGEVIGRDLDLYAFWHSSQRNDPGLNIALYTSRTADRLLEEARIESDRAERLELYQRFASEVERDVPAVFTYTPNFIYVLPSKLSGVSLGAVTIPSERFLHVGRWFIETDSVWKIFLKRRAARRESPAADSIMREEATSTPLE